MSSKLAKHAYEQLVREDLEWLDRQPRTLERDHVEAIVKNSVEMHYPPDREGRVGHEFVEGSAHGTACPAHEHCHFNVGKTLVYRPCYQPRSAHTGGKAESRSVQKRVAAQRGDYPPQPAPQGGGGERPSGPYPSQSELYADPRDSQLAEKDARIADLQKRGDDAIKQKAVLHAQWLRRFSAAETMLAAQSAEIEKLKGWITALVGAILGGEILRNGQHGYAGIAYHGLSRVGYEAWQIAGPLVSRVEDEILRARERPPVQGS